MTEEKADPSENQSDPSLYRPDQVDPCLSEKWQQKIQLKDTAVKMSVMEASVALARLRDLQRHQPEHFQTLVALVKPRGAARSLGEATPKSLAELKQNDFVAPDGTPKPRLAAVLDSAYVETAEGVILRDPIIYPSAQFAQELSQFEANAERQVVRLLTEELKKPKGKNGGEGPSR